MRRKPLPSLLQEANDNKVLIRNSLDMAVYYFVTRKKDKK
jgi:hypothetical protein